MHLGLGLYRHMLTPAHYAFAAQSGATHVVAHLVDYFTGARAAAAQAKGKTQDDQPLGDRAGWGVAGDPNQLWTEAELKQLRKDVESHGLTLAAIENLDPAHWHDVLLDGPQRDRHIENVKTILRRMGSAGIPTLGYNFSIAGVAGRSSGPWARGGAVSVGMQGVDDTPVPPGMAWNMVVDEPAFRAAEAKREANPAAPPPPPVPHDELWRRLERFLDDVLPVAESAGVTLAAHPDDPPVPVLRNTPRLVYQPSMYDRLLAIRDSDHNALEFCIGSLAEMTETARPGEAGESGQTIYDIVDHYAATGRIAYVHFRNVKDRAPHYKETFVDDGEVDMLKVVRILKKHDFQGVLIPDHTPQLTCDAPWHAGMAYALGWMRCALQTLEAEPSET